MNLKNLKIRLEKLPKLKDEIHLAFSFRDYTQKIRQLRKRIDKTYKNIKFASKVGSETQYEKKVMSELNKAVKESSKLFNLIEADSARIQNKSTENSVIKIRDASKKAISFCEIIWQCEIDGSVAKWEKIAIVVKSLGAKGGKELKQAVDRLKYQEIPRNDEEVNKINGLRKDLQKGITKLGLEGPFGKFLESAAESGASPKELLKSEIKEKLDEYKLWESFKIRIG